MKLALLLPGYLDSPDYLHLMTFEKRLQVLGYITERLDLCHLWQTGNVKEYTITNSLNQIKERVDFYRSQNPEEVVLIGHSMGGFTAIIAGSRISGVTKIVSLCPPPDKKASVKKWSGKGSRVSKRDLPNNPEQFKEFAIPYSYLEDALQYSAVDEVGKIHKPLMIFISLEDTVVLPELTEKIVENTNSPYVVRKQGMGHDFRHSQSECDLVMKEIEQFLKNNS